MASSTLRDELSCSICLNLYTEPVSLRCGHNFCRDCIVTALDTQSGVYSCPECREEHEEHPTLEKNRKLGNIVESFKSTQQEEKSKIFCTYCLDSPTPAAKTCMHCEISMCENHLTAHNKTVDHMVVDPTSSFNAKKCSIHKKLLEYYCSEDAACLCVSCCLVGKHKGHEVELLEEASEKKKEKLRSVQEKLSMGREATRVKIERLQEHKRKVQEKGDAEKKRVSVMYEEIRRQLEVQEHTVLSEISRQVEEVSRSVTDLIKELETEKDEISGKISDIEELCNTSDPITVLQGQESDSGDQTVEEPSPGDLDEFMISLVLHKSISTLTTNMELKSNPYLQEVTDLRLNERTANEYVTLSDDLRTASDSELAENRPTLPERFTKYYQVMSVESFSHGRHYWEVEVGNCGEWDVGVCYPSIKREGEESGLGLNNKSWSLQLYDDHYEASHDSHSQELNRESSAQKLGIYLDYEGGRLSFYQLTDPIRHLHTFTATFTEPLHAAFYLNKGAWVKLISPVFPVKPEMTTNIVL